MKAYLDLLQDIRDNGYGKDDRTGTGTRSVFGRQLRFDLAEGFPLLTTKKVFLKGIIYELLWFLNGDTNIKYLNDHGVHIWDEWATETGDLGPIYGKQWRTWEAPSGEKIDQIAMILKQIKETPHSRRIIVSGWNPADLPDEGISPQQNAANNKAALPPCHTLFQFYVSKDNKLSCQLYQRSADVFLGVPFNIASYAMFTMMVAQVCDLELGEFVHTFGDVHIYNNHIDQVNEQLSREPRALPRLVINSDVTDLFSFAYEDFMLENYDPYPVIKAPISI